MPDFARYETPAARHRLLGLCCTGTGYKSGVDYVCGPRTLGCYAAVYVGRHAGWLQTAATDGRLPVAEKSLFWLFPTVAHSYGPDEAGGPGWDEHWVLFEGPLAETFERLGYLSPARPVVRTGAAPEIASLFAQIHVDFATGGPLAGVLSAALVHRLVMVAHHLDAMGRGDGDPATPDVRAAVARLEERALDRLRIEDIAREHGMGYSTFRRRFKELTGYGPKEYVLRVRLRKAKELLAYTSQSVAEVAAAVGFDDPYYFSRLFHDKEGLSPTTFRAQQSFTHGDRGA